ncbi:MAG TPA: U32 family peptidase [Thermodesulfobacteriaceae bacterium]|nr:U32 family peptidase [Thermodesulfobacteriaceae bacterium]
MAESTTVKTEHDILRKPELLSPAGDWTCLRAALNAGCDAVYFGVQDLNMRAGARNFMLSDIPELTALCRAFGVRAYLALNTIVYEYEKSVLAEVLDCASESGVDAVICWDFSVIRQALRRDMPVHISTQMSISNTDSILFFYHNLGIRRFVLARECSLEDIVSIRQRLSRELGERAGEIEIEVFVHGAMCVSISGRCFLSQFWFGRSANRGECIQPCRREYFVMDRERKCSFLLGNTYIMSPNDLCAMPFLEKLIESGVSSLKIEGRNKSPEYVSTVTSSYRNALDYYFVHRSEPDFSKKFGDLKEKLTGELSTVYNRGFSSGFFMGKPIDKWTDRHGSSATKQKEYSGVVTNYFKKIGVAEVKVESKSLRVGDRVLIQGPTTGIHSEVIEAMEVNHSRVEEAGKGASVAVKLNRLVRRNDRVYIVCNKR